jgi:phosphoribosylanthranilate isomerase
MKTIPKIKICGITSIENGTAIARLSPDYMGFIINYPKSPRNVGAVKVKEIISEIKKISPSIKSIGVFVDQDPEVVKKIVQICGLDIVQLHGQESVKDVKEIKKVCEVWKSVIIANEGDVKNAEKYRSVADKILFDAGKGSGNQITLSLLKNENVNILAGGLGVDNIEKILAQIRPEIVDANSKLESSPGKKDINLVEQFIRKVRNSNS